jgi:hypothetical protein
MLWVRKIDYKTAKAFIERHHYPLFRSEQKPKQKTRDARKNSVFV